MIAAARRPGQYVNPSVFMAQWAWRRGEAGSSAELNNHREEIKIGTSG